MDLSRDGPGLLLRDIEGGKDPQIAAIASVIGTIKPDVIVFQDIDYDLENLALMALRNQVFLSGVSYPHLFALRPNTGLQSGHDLDGDGRRGEPEDAHGYGRFSGQGGMAILSRHPILTKDARDLSTVKWVDLPGALLSDDEGNSVLPPAAIPDLRLTEVANWIVPLQTPTGRVTLLALHASPPVFDGPEDRNGRRNHDQIMFWMHVMNGVFGSAPTDRFVVIGDTNQDPLDGEGRKAAIRALLNDPRLQDPKPRRPGPVEHQPGHQSDPLLDTVAWPLPDPGHMRVDYVLPSRDWTVLDAGVYWPLDGPNAETIDTASRHRLVWVDLAQ